MKSILVPACLFLAVIPGQAAPLLYEPFNYTAGTSLEAKSPNGVDLWWPMGTATPGADQIMVAGGNLTISGLPGPIGNSIAYGGTGRTARISIGTPITTGTVYYSFVMSVTDIATLDASGGFLAGFNNTTPTIASATQPTVIGTRLLTRSSGGGYQIGVEKNSGMAGNFIFDSTIRTVGDTIFVVGSYTFATGSGTDDISLLWINPSSVDFGAPSAPPPTVTANVVGTDLAQVASFLFRQGSATTVPGVNIDELRVDTTWAGVTAPEPGSIVLLAIAGGGLLMRRRRSHH